MRELEGVGLEVVFSPLHIQVIKLAISFYVVHYIPTIYVLTKSLAAHVFANQLHNCSMHSPYHSGAHIFMYILRFYFMKFPENFKFQEKKDRINKYNKKCLFVPFKNLNIWALSASPTICQLIFFRASKNFVLFSLEKHLLVIVLFVDLGLKVKGSLSITGK